MALCKLTKNEAVELQKLVNAYDGARSELVDWLSNLHGEWESAIEDRSEKWREGEAGQEAQGRLDTLGAWVDELPDDVPLDVEQLS